MKTICITISLLFFKASSFGQFSELENEFMNFERNHKDSLTQAMYIDSSFCSKYNLRNITQKFRRMNVWQSRLNYDSKDFIGVSDIRWQFKDNEEAAAFHKKFLTINSEYGEEIQNSKITIDNVTELRIFRENARARKLNEAFGSPMNFYYFIFVVDNSVAKVFVNTKTTTTVDQAAVFAKEAALRLNEYKNSK